ncbi:hypothetical protein V5799_032250 [Amblyomma americanum]|uniref:Uncharacterized protein n=1 Tax=Amblyomma americanum TaxID=6943 RepID=A0AAQ4DRP9_AMBAM
MDALVAFLLPANAGTISRSCSKATRASSRRLRSIALCFLLSALGGSRDSERRGLPRRPDCDFELNREDDGKKSSSRRERFLCGEDAADPWCRGLLPLQPTTTLGQVDARSAPGCVWPLVSALCDCVTTRQLDLVRDATAEDAGALFKPPTTLGDDPLAGSATKAGAAPLRRPPWSLLLDTATTATSSSTSSSSTQKEKTNRRASGSPRQRDHVGGIDYDKNGSINLTTTQLSSG